MIRQRPPVIPTPPTRAIGHPTRISPLLLNPYWHNFGPMLAVRGNRDSALACRVLETGAESQTALRHAIPGSEPSSTATVTMRPCPVNQCGYHWQKRKLRKPSTRTTSSALVQKYRYDCSHHESRSTVQATGRLGLKPSGSAPLYRYDARRNSGVLFNEADGSSPKYHYDASGKLIRLAAATTKATPFRSFVKHQAKESEFIYYGYRYYNPSTGRWLSRDPIEEKGGLNLYGFVGNVPINSVDPLGLTCCGPDVTFQLRRTLENVDAIFWLWTDAQATSACDELVTFTKGGASWEIQELRALGIDTSRSEPCGRTFSYRGQCYYASALNYALWGKAMSLCARRSAMLRLNNTRSWNYETAMALAAAWKFHIKRGESLWGDEESQALAFTTYGYFGVLPNWGKKETSGCVARYDSVRQYAFHWRWMPIRP